MSIFWIMIYIFVNLTSVLSLGAITLYAVLDIPIMYSVIALAMISAIYTIYGGLSAVVWTDFVQVGVLVLGGLAVVWLGLESVSANYSTKGIIAGFTHLLESQSEKFHTVLPASNEELPCTGKASSREFIWSENNSLAIKPGKTMIMATTTDNIAANSKPFCASFRFFAANARWMMYWLHPQ